MRRKKRIEPDQAVDLRMTARQKTLILDTSADPGLIRQLETTTRKGTKLIASYTLDDLEELSGFVAAEANHCRDAKLRRELYSLFLLIPSTMEQYDDGNWPSSVPVAPGP